MAEEYDLKAFHMPHDATERGQAIKFQLRTKGVAAAEHLISIKKSSPELILYWASELNFVDIMVLMVEKYGANIDTMVLVEKDFEATALIGAAVQGSTAAIKWLLKRGADVEKYHKATDGGFTALWGACERGFLRVVRLLLDHGANVDTYKRRTGNTALYIAAQKGFGLVCAELIRHGAQVDLSMGPNPTPLVIAVANAHAPVVALLRNVGASAFDSRQDLIIALGLMGNSGMTAVSENSRKVTNDEINVLRQLISSDGVEKLDATVPKCYSVARVFEQRGEYRKALKYISMAENELEQMFGSFSVGKNAMWTQLRFDEQRLLDAVYGVKGSDGRVAAWHRHVIFESDIHPPPLMFYSWVRYGDVIYRYGGLRFLEYKKLPSEEEFWAFNIRSKTWDRIETSGDSPGPRAGHASGVHDNQMYLFGGKSINGVTDSKLYRLNLLSFKWQVVKTKGLKPPPRDATAGVVYNGKFYIYGGTSQSFDYCNDLWRYSFESKRWKKMPGGGTPRGDHGMWAANERIYILGGENLKPNYYNSSASRLSSTRTIVAFETFDLDTKRWQSLRCVGNDPWDLMEFTVLPIFRDQDEPSAVIVWGGHKHNEPTTWQGDAQGAAEFKKKYGVESADACMPYRRRLLRFDLETHVWTLLEPLCDVDILPTAQSFAAELRTEGQVTRILIGGGYGLTGTSMPQSPSDPEIPASLKSRIEQEGWDSKTMFEPECRNEVFEVEVLVGTGAPFAERAANGIGWEWDFFDTPSARKPGGSIELSAWSPTVHLAMHVCSEDFVDYASDVVPGNDDDGVLGRRVILRGLKSRKDLNGCIGRTGSWIPKQQRYKVFIPAWEDAGPCVVSAQSCNLSFAPALRSEELMKSTIHCFPTPYIAATFCKSVDDKRGPLDVLLGRREQDGMGMKMSGFSDYYHGPLSSRADAILQEVCEKAGNGLVHIYLPECVRKKLGKPRIEGMDVVDGFVRYETFVESLAAADKVRVKKYESEIRLSRDKKSWGEWLALTVTIDGLDPQVERTLVVSPNVTLSQLHHQVLCPAIGWSSNLHSYAFRRIYPSKKLLEPPRRNPECWIGPKVATSIDSFFQPYYIGGDVANDRKIYLGDLFMPDESGQSTIQYVYDFGDWWSHTIVITRPDTLPPPGTTVAYLVTGTGYCPPEDCRGILGYGDEMSKLSAFGTVDPRRDCFGKSSELYMESFLDPSRPEWWSTLNGETRGKLNTASLSNPLTFDIVARRSALDDSLHRLVFEKGTQHEQVACLSQKVYRLWESGSSMASQRQRRAEPTDICAVCGVTLALKLCSGCKQVAYCCRSHQVDHWPKHKKDCGALQSKLGKSES